MLHKNLQKTYWYINVFFIHITSTWISLSLRWLGPLWYGSYALLIWLLSGASQKNELGKESYKLWLLRQGDFQRRHEHRLPHFLVYFLPPPPSIVLLPHPLFWVREEFPLWGLVWIHCMHLNLYILRWIKVQIRLNLTPTHPNTCDLGDLCEHESIQKSSTGGEL